MIFVDSAKLLVERSETWAHEMWEKSKLCNFYQISEIYLPNKRPMFLRLYATRSQVVVAWIWRCYIEIFLIPFNLK